MSSPRTEATAATLHWSGMTHPGKVRRNNEDSFLALAIDAHEARYLGKIGEASMAAADFVFAVSDGMGGARSGEFASKIAVEEITRLLPQSFRSAAQGFSVGFEDILTEIFQRIHAKLTLLGRSYEDCSGMGATLSLCWFMPGQAAFGHIGDSRLYHLPRDGGIRQISHDHSQVGWMRRNGQLTEHQARVHPRRSVLNRALGAGHQFVDPQIGLVRYEPGDRILLATDGLIDGLVDSRLETVCRAPDHGGRSPAQHLVEESIESSGRDNTTALLVEVA